MNRSRKISCPILLGQYLQVMMMMMMIMAVVVLWRGTNVNVIINPVLISAFSTTTTNHHHHHSYAPHTIQHPSHLIRIQNPTLSSNPRKSQQQQQQHDSLLFQTNPASRPPPPRGSSSSPRSLSSLSSTRLNMVPVIASSSSLLFGTTAAFVSAISGGICSGGLHAIAGTYWCTCVLPNRTNAVASLTLCSFGIPVCMYGCWLFRWSGKSHDKIGGTLYLTQARIIWPPCCHGVSGNDGIERCGWVRYGGLDMDYPPLCWVVWRF